MYDITFINNSMIIYYHLVSLQSSPFLPLPSTIAYGFTLFITIRLGLSATRSVLLLVCHLKHNKYVLILVSLLFFSLFLFHQMKPFSQSVYAKIVCAIKISIHIFHVGIKICAFFLSYNFYIGNIKTCHNSGHKQMVFQFVDENFGLINARIWFKICWQFRANWFDLNAPDTIASEIPHF